MNPSLSILIADDHPLFRRGLRQAIEENADLGVTGEAADGAAALRQIEELKPDVAILDINMPAMSGLQVAKAVRDRKLFVAVVVLTVYKEEEMFNEAMDFGVRGYVLKETAVSDIIEAIKTVADGRYYLSPSLSGHIVSRSRSARALLEKIPSIADLTPAERRVLRLISQSKTSKEIAEELGVSYRTIETHRTNIAEKLNIHGTHSLLKFALRNKAILFD